MEHTVNTPAKVYAAADNIISSLGFDTAENMMGIRNGKSGIRRLYSKKLYPQHIYAAAIDDERLGQLAREKGIEGYCRLEQLFILSILDLQRQVAIDFSAPDTALIFSSTKGNIDLLEPDPTARPEALYLHGMARRVGDWFGVRNRPIVLSNACISGVAAIVVAKRLIEAGVYRHVVVAGGDMLTRFVSSGFFSFKSLSRRGCKPYDRSRDGLTLGEACGSLLLTADAGLIGNRQLAVVVEGGAVTNDANHISAPSRTGDGLASAILQAMQETGLRPEHISFVNAHGTGTSYNDEMESKAIHLAGLQEVPVNSLKPYWGHTLGASGVIESIACMAQLRQNVLWGTLRFKTPGVPMPLVLSDQHRAMEMKRCIKTASGFGGCNAAVVFSLEIYAGRSRKGGRQATLTGECVVRRNRIRIDDGRTSEFPELDFPQLIRLMYKALDEDNKRFFKMDDLCKLGYTAMGYFLKYHPLDGRYRPEDVGILLANSTSSLETDMDHQHFINDKPDQDASPSKFVYTLPNIVLGEICIGHNFRGENLFFLSGSFQQEAMENYARLLIDRGVVKACFFGWCEWDGYRHEATLCLMEANE